MIVGQSCVSRVCQHLPSTPLTSRVCHPCCDAAWHPCDDVAVAPCVMPVARSLAAEVE